MRPYGKQQQHLVNSVIEPVDPCQFLVDVALLIAESRDCGVGSDSQKDIIHCLPISSSSTSSCNAEAASSLPKKHVCDHSLAQCRQAKQIVDETKSLWSRNIPVCLHVLVLPEKCTNNSECFTTAPVIEQWTIQTVPKRLLPTNHNQLWDCTTLLRAIRSHLHFSHLSSFAIKCHGKSPIVTSCRIRVPGDLDGEASSLASCSSSSFDNVLSLTEKHQFRSCLLAKSLILNVCVESAPRSFGLDNMVCNCIGAVQARDDGNGGGQGQPQGRPDSGSPCSSNSVVGRAPSPATPDDTANCDDLPSSSKYIRREEESPSQDTTKRRSTSKKNYSATNQIFDLNLRADVHRLGGGPGDVQFFGSSTTTGKGDTKTAESGAEANVQIANAKNLGEVEPRDFDDLGENGGPCGSKSSQPLQRQTSDVRFFVADDEDDANHGQHHSPIKRLEHQSRDTYGDDWVNSSTGGGGAYKSSPSSRERMLRCRKILFDESTEDAPSLLDLAGAAADSSSADESACSFTQSHVITCDDYSSEYGSGESLPKGKSKATAPEHQSGRRQFMPSFFSRKWTKQKSKNAGILQFNRRTGLPLSSSPAPMTRNRNSFDFDSNLCSVSAIRKSLQGYDHESGSSDSDSGVPLCKSAPACTNLLGNFEESALNGRIKPFGSVDGFTLELGASGSFWPSHVTLTITTLFFNVSDDNAPSPYFGHCSLEPLGKKGYHTPKKGTIQATLFNPQGTVVKMFVVRYDLSDMPAYCQTFVRQRTFFMPSGATLEDALRNRSWLRYLIHLRFATSRSGKLYLHTDIRMLFSRKSELDAYNCDYGSSDCDLETYELRSFTETPKNPKFSPRKCANVDRPEKPTAKN